MTRQMLNESQYLAELNRELRLDEAYEHGMEFVPAPDGARGSEMSGFDNVGPVGVTDIYARVAERVERKFVYSPKVGEPSPMWG